MSEETDRFKLWKVYSILMGVMLSGSTLFLGGQAAWNAWSENTDSSPMSVTLRPSVTPVASLPTLKPDKEKPSTSLALTTPQNEVSISREQTTTKAQASPVNHDFNAEVFDPPSNCRIRPEANSSVKQVLQKGDVLVDRNNPQTDSKRELWYREKYLGCWLHNSQIRFKATSDFNAEIFDPPSNCRAIPGADSSVKHVLQKGDVLVDRNSPQTDSKGEPWYREQYLGCWLHNSQIRFK